MNELNKKIGSYRWTICSLVFFATTINYLDRQVISLLKPFLEQQFQWTEKDYATIVMVFQLCYAAGLMGVGYVIDRIGTKLGYAISLFLWSVAAILHAAAKSTLGFSVWRGLLGISEAGNFPAAIKTMAEWFPKKERALATGLFNSGTNVGAIAAPLVVPWIAVNWGWQWAFIITGAIGLIWLVFWLLIYEVPERHKKLSAAELAYINSDIEENIKKGEEVEGLPKVRWIKLIGFKQTWAFIIGKFMTDPVWWFFLFWLPSYLKAKYDLVNTQVSLPLMLVYTLATCGSILGGWLPLYFIKKGWLISKARKTSMLLYAFFPLLIISAQFIDKNYMWLAFIVIGIAAAAHQAWSANIFTTVSDMFPKNAVSSVTGLGGMAGALGGMGIAGLAGFLLDHFKALGDIKIGYYVLFIICGIAYLLAWTIMFKILIPKMKPIEIKD